MVLIVLWCCQEAIHYMGNLLQIYDFGRERKYTVAVTTRRQANQQRTEGKDGTNDEDSNEQMDIIPQDFESPVLTDTPTQKFELFSIGSINGKGQYNLSMLSSALV